ncbi:MAG: hypothetical protein ACR2QG_01735 [Gammaproteobacteria bacterium]
MRNKSLVLIAVLLGSITNITLAAERTVGVLFVVHGGSEESSLGNTFDNSLQFFQYDPNNVVYNMGIWKPRAWPNIVKAEDSQDYANAATQYRKYSFQINRVGGKDFAPNVTDRQFEEMTRQLEVMGKERGIRFITDNANWLGSQTFIHRLAWPRQMYNSQIGNDVVLNYCGSEKDGGPWKNCNPERYNVDGPGERLLKRGAEEIIMVDLTTTGVRFWKTYDVVRTTRRMVADWNERNGTDIQVRWVNDPTDLMRDSFPTEPANWTRSAGAPIVDPQVPLEGRPNPLIEDPLLINSMVDGIIKGMNPDVSPANTAVLLINHSIRNGNEVYDPKVNDTVRMDGLVKEELLRRYPEMKPENVMGGWMGLRQPNPNVVVRRKGGSNLERTREMRGESLGNAWLYQSDRVLPGGDHQYRYWETLDMYRQRDEVQHIVVAFTQVITDNFFNLVEVPNQVGKEIGWKNWLQAETLDFKTYPEIGHPFADYWGNWVKPFCKVIDGPEDATEPCCFEMGGCPDTNQPYPPLRQTAINKKRQDTDPSLAFDVSAYGHLGYDQSKGPPSEDKPVQDQYTGTWEMYQPANDDPRIGKLLARQVVKLLDSETEQVASMADNNGEAK